MNFSLKNPHSSRERFKAAFTGLFGVVLAFLVASGVRADFEPTANPKTESQVIVLPQPLDRGSPARVIIRNIDLEAEVTGKFDDKPIFFFRFEDALVGLFGADVMLASGVYPLTVTWGGPVPSGQTILEVTVKEKSYGFRDIKVPQNQVELSAEDLARTQRESQETIKALATKSPEKLWTGQFIEPVEGHINSSFGRQTRLNGILNARPHAGADYLVREGTPVKAPAVGRVILCDNHFFTGNSIYIDHGQGLITMYFHLSAIEVAKGDLVERSQIIGKVGRTGRVTGAHLHYGVYINGARIDPPVFRHMIANLLGS
ncbi:MAG: M23 family metallopeptidase [Deltaproteobacteria bacterium]|jgi:hypothetical protein|nr:M23 family metallopeptidase [Deltaproteobacteria bacterium]